MNRIAVGSSGCSFGRIAEVLCEEPHGTQLDPEWQKLADRLETPSHTISNLKIKRKGGIALKGLLIILLKEWTSRQKSDATMTALLNILDCCQFSEDSNIAHHFWKSFYLTIRPDTTWEDLDERTRNNILDKFVQLPATTKTLRLRDLYQDADLNSVDSNTIKKWLNNESFRLEMRAADMSHIHSYPLVIGSVAVPLSFLIYYGFKQGTIKW